MRHQIRQSIIVLLIFLTLFVSVSAQENQKPPHSASVAETEDLKAALAVDDTDARVASLQQFLKAYPNSEKTDSVREALVQSYAIMAERLLAAQEIEKAVAIFRQALSSLPATISDLFFQTTLIKIPLAVAVRGYRMEAISLAQVLEPACHDHPARMMELSEFYLSLEAADNAIRLLESAAKMEANDAKLYRTLGMAYRMALRLKEAEAAHQQAVMIDPSDGKSYYELGNLRRARGAYEEAVKYYHRQQELEPANTASLKGIALTLIAQGKAGLAEKELEKIRGLTRKDSELTQDYFLQTQLAFYYLIRGQNAQARQAAEMAVGTEPRFTWGRIAAAEVEMAENRYFEAERHLLAAKQYGNFPSLYFALGRLYLIAEDFDYSLSQFNKAFSYSSQDGFKARLGGVLDAQSKRLADLHVLEQQAALYIFEPVTPYTQFRLVEALIRFDKALGNKIETEGTSTSARQSEEIENAASEFVGGDIERSPFRALYVSQKLAMTGKALEAAVKFAELALKDAEIATEPEGSLRDYPNYDRKGRLQIFRGRAADAKGWALLKLGRTEESLSALNLATEYYGDLPEGRQARWHLATARETAGDIQEALKLYIAAYERPQNAHDGDVNRAIIESLYLKVHGSLAGLDAQIGKSVTAQVAIAEPSQQALIRKEAAEAEVKPEITAGLNDNSIVAARSGEQYSQLINTSTNNVQGKFEIVRPDLSLPVVLPKVKNRSDTVTVVNVADINLPWESVVTDNSAEAEVPPSPIFTTSITRPRRAEEAESNALQSHRPRKVTKSSSELPLAVPATSTRKRRVGNSDNSPEEKP